MKEIILWDSGTWGKRFTDSRIFKAIRIIEAEEEVRLTELRYVKADSVFSTRLKGEPADVYQHREKSRENIQCARVENTANHFDYRFQRDTPEDIHPIVGEGNPLFLFISLPPSETKTELITSLLQSSDVEATIVISPATFRDAKDVEKLIEIEKKSSNKRVIVFSPYRFSAGVLSVYEQRKQKNETIAGVSTSIISGPYPRQGIRGFSTFLNEFSSPIIDAHLQLCGAAVESGSLTYYETKNRRPIMAISCSHETGCVSSFFLSATGHFQSVNFDTRVYLSRSQIHLVDAFRDTRIYEANHAVFTEGGHDRTTENRNGYLTLLKGVLRNEAEVDEEKIPDLTSYLKTQRFIDLIDSTIESLQRTGGQKHRTF